PLCVLTPRIPDGGIFPSPCRRKTISTASMHSVRPKSSRMSLRPSSSVLLVSIWSSYEMDNVIARFCFHGYFAASEDSGASFASQCDSAVFANQPGTFANADHGYFVLL